MDRESDKMAFSQPPRKENMPNEEESQQGSGGFDRGVLVRADNDDYYLVLRDALPYKLTPDEKDRVKNVAIPKAEAALTEALEGIAAARGHGVIVVVPRVS